MLGPTEGHTGLLGRHQRRTPPLCTITNSEFQSVSTFDATPTFVQLARQASGWAGGQLGNSVRVLHLRLYSVRPFLMQLPSLLVLFSLHLHMVRNRSQRTVQSCIIFAPFLRKVAIMFFSLQILSGQFLTFVRHRDYAVYFNGSSAAAPSCTLPLAHPVQPDRGTE